MGDPTPTETIPALLVRHIPRDLVMGIEEALLAGAARAYSAAAAMEDGHLPHVVGQLRHFNMNETFHHALQAGNASPSPICGNSVIVGRAGVFTLSRFNTPEGVWINGRRSKTRRQMSLANAAIEPLVQQGLFGAYTPPADAVAFFVSCFSGSMRVQPEAPVSIQIAVPDRHMSGWLFRERLDMFLERYEAKPAAKVQDDLAMPKLKLNTGTQRKDGTTR